MEADGDRVGRLLGAGTGGSVYEARIGGTACALKTFDNAQLFRAEVLAYRAIAQTPSLAGRVCSFYGVYEGANKLLRHPCYPRALRLSLVPGHTLWEILQSPPPRAERDRQQHYLRHTLRLLHDDAGVCHGDIKEDNILVHGENAFLLDFGAATVRGVHQTSDRRWRHSIRSDIFRLGQIYDRANSREASEQAAVLLGNLCSNSCSQRKHLAHLLSRILPEHANTALLDRVNALFPTPPADLALALGTLLGATNKVHSALSILDAAISREEAKSSEHQERTTLINMLATAAAYKARTELVQKGSCAPSTIVYQRAIALALDTYRGHSTSLPLVQLRLAYATNLRRRGDHREAIRVLMDIIVDLNGIKGYEDTERVVDLVEQLLRSTSRSVANEEDLMKEMDKAKSMLYSSALFRSLYEE